MSSPAPIRSVMILGYGVMGRGVAISFAAAGFETVVLSRRAASLTDLPPGATAVAEPPAQAPDLIIENLGESLDDKRPAYARMEAAYGGKPIIATNSSGLDLTELDRDLKFPERFCGAHYFQPAETSPVVEVMAGSKTDPEVLDLVADALRRTGKQPLLLRRPIVGYLINRLQHAILHEAYHLVETGVATVVEIDLVARLTLGPRMCVTGLVEQKDLSGLTIHAAAQRGIVPTLAHTNTPVALLQNLEAAGHLGLSTGRGFYDWRATDPAAVRTETGKRLRELLAFLEGQGPRPEGTVPRAVG